MRCDLAESPCDSVGEPQFPLDRLEAWLVAERVEEPGCVQVLERRAPRAHRGIEQIDCLGMITPLRIYRGAVESSAIARRASASALSKHSRNAAPESERSATSTSRQLPTPKASATMPHEWRGNGNGRARRRPERER